MSGDRPAFTPASQSSSRSFVTGRAATGKAVRISGYEEWTIGPDGLITESKGHFDEAEYGGTRP